MRSWAIPYADAALALALLFAPAPAAAAFQCGEIVNNKYTYNLEALGGPHAVVTTQTDGSLIHNTTYTVDICAPLKRKGDVEKSKQCPDGSRACAIKHLITIGKGDPVDQIDEVTALAGELTDHGGGPLDPKITQLSEIDPKSGKEGLRVIFNGGFYYFHSVKRKQQTIIDFVCAKDLEGTEGEYESEDKYESALVKVRADDDKKKDGDDDADKDKNKDEDGGKGGNKDENAPSEVQLGIENKPSLVFEGYGPGDDTSVDVLRLTWSSKHVCRKDAGDGSDGGDDDKGGEKKSSSHWGAFTWIVLLFFLGTAAYLIFGSWLNYTRYGARGWDLLPHGDTIRDIPYLMKDWARRVLNTVQGSGSRGGYSAV